jgi:hypothetical protein
MARRADRPTAITAPRRKKQRSMDITPHIAQDAGGRSSAIDRPKTGTAALLSARALAMRIEQTFGWIKTIARQEKTSFRGRDRVAWAFTTLPPALWRLSKLIAGTG